MVCFLHRWSLPNPEYYTLRYADGPQLYITEQVSAGGAESDPREEVVLPALLTCKQLLFTEEELPPRQMGAQQPCL